MTSPCDDEPISLAQAAELVSPLRGGKAPHVSTLRFWARWGLRGIRLETILVGGRRFTSRGALYRFLDLLNRAPTTSPALPDEPWPYSE